MVENGRLTLILTLTSEITSEMRFTGFANSAFAFVLALHLGFFNPAERGMHEQAPEERNEQSGEVELKGDADLGLERYIPENDFLFPASLTEGIQRWKEFYLAKKPERLRLIRNRMESYREDIEQASGAYSNNEVIEYISLGLIGVESQAYPLAVSQRGAQGLMQLMPSTSRGLGLSNPFNPEENIAGGVQYLACDCLLQTDIPHFALLRYLVGPDAINRIVKKVGLDFEAIISNIKKEQRETVRQYPAHVLALAELLGNPEEELADEYYRIKPEKLAMRDGMNNYGQF